MVWYLTESRDSCRYRKDDVVKLYRISQHLNDSTITANIPESQSAAVQNRTKTSEARRSLSLCYEAGVTAAVSNPIRADFENFLTALCLQVLHRFFDVYVKAQSLYLNL